MAAPTLNPVGQLRRELGLRDLVFAQVLNVVGSFWVGVAAKLGNAHAVFWALSMLLFYVPLALVVIYLNRVLPLEAAYTSGQRRRSAPSGVSSSRGTCGVTRSSSWVAFSSRFPPTFLTRSGRVPPGFRRARSPPAR